MVDDGKRGRSMSKRLQVLLSSTEFQRLRRMAQRKGVTVAAWVRDAIQRALRDRPEKSPARKLAALRSAVRHSFPTADIGAMLADIERGRARGGTA
jgi:predicted metal-dependent HD superfamily phosphohydrolase